MNKSEFVAAIADEMKSTKAEASRALDALLKVVKKVLKKGQELRLVGFGTFKVVSVPAKEVRNPQNGQKIKVPACKRPKFIAGKDLKKVVNS
ncbi:HU family DNA-binding protein [Rickettsiales endosymbiont of Peranema trichophorum]|uniref:HU family DNA-binding protein n=1 Tax=Rickettsiales endosymbiont of Peranema trichophorum TaxID=2486577 RepID=UPI001022D1E7|nr:HU family DNA-binding protein [Rickettsiales endosymbiont of Peranema trichophorum]RZI47281.1 HU family DNA-binding protein [Rickettsiales endosymbiont of Peranema trichophorum]